MQKENYNNNGNYNVSFDVPEPFFVNEIENCPAQTAHCNQKKRKHASQKHFEESSRWSECFDF
jgi:hypothetical protein